MALPRTRRNAPTIRALASPNFRTTGPMIAPWVTTVTSPTKMKTTPVARWTLSIDQSARTTLSTQRMNTELRAKTAI